MYKKIGITKIYRLDFHFSFRCVCDTQDRQCIFNIIQQRGMYETYILAKCRSKNVVYVCTHCTKKAVIWIIQKLETIRKCNFFPCMLLTLKYGLMAKNVKRLATKTKCFMEILTQFVAGCLLFKGGDKG